MDLSKLFYPKSIAVVGASPNMGGGKIPYYQIQKSSGFAGPVYPVNPKHDEIGGVKVYKSVAELPESVDLAICSVPAAMALEVVEQAAAKDIPFVHFFTSGFSEAGHEGREKELIAAGRGKTRIVGPNCIGVMCSESRVTFDPTVLARTQGKVAFLGQSGGVTNNFTRAVHSLGIPINKAVSYGNQIDIRVEDYIDYFMDDDTVAAVAAYIEDIKDGRRFFDVLKRRCRTKPLIVLKGGVTEEGAVAAHSHTGAMAGSREVFSALLRQARALEVDTPERLMDVTALAVADKLPRGSRAAFLGAGGGTSVLFTDLAVSAGLSMPELSRKTQADIQQWIPEVNTSTRNPVDLGAFGIDYRIMNMAMKAADPDPNVDLLVPYFSVDFMSMFPDDKIQSAMKKTAEAAAAAQKPVVPVVSRADQSDPRMDKVQVTAMRIFREAGVAAFRTPQDAAYAISRVLEWRRS